MVITRRELLDAGLTRHQVAAQRRAGLLLDVPGVRGVYVRAGPAPVGTEPVGTEPVGTEIAAALAAAGPLAFAYRRSAAALWGLDGFTEGEDGWSSRAEVAVARNRAGRAGVHRLSGLVAGDVVRVGGFRATGVGRTLVDLGQVCSADLVERATECALRRRLVGERELRDRAASRYRRGGPVLRDVLGRRPDGTAPTESDAETRFLQLCRADGIPEPVRQFVVVLGRRYRLDFAWPWLRVAVEIDGAVAHGPDRRGADLRRQNQIVVAGWVVLRFTWEDVVLYPGEVAAMVRRALAAGALAPGVAE